MSVAEDLEISRKRPALSAAAIATLAVHAAFVLALVPALLLVGRSADWGDPLLLGTLVVLAIAADRADVPLPTALRVDATIAVTLLALVTLGAVPALLVAVLPILAEAATGRDRLVRAGNLANVAAYGWELVAASLVLAACPHPIGSVASLPWIVLAGPVMLLTQWAVGPAIYGTLWLGHPLRALVRMLLDLIPAAAVILALGAVTAILYAPFGILALGLFALIAIVPQTALTYVARTRSVARLDRQTATERYAHALALQLGLGRAERRHLIDVVRLAAGREDDAGDPVAHAYTTLRDPSRPSLEAGHASEWWNGGGVPAGLRGALIPPAARIAAVAGTWASLTARDTLELPHQEALAEMRATAGTRLDPGVVEAAFAVVAQERVTPEEPAPEPRLHRFGVPARLRAAMASA